MDIPEISTAGQPLFWIIAFAAGLVSFLSPCVLPLVPGYLGYLGASAEPGDNQKSRRPILGSLFFVLGFTAVFVLFLTSLGGIGLWLLEWEQTITRVMGALIIVMGLVFMGVFQRLQTTKKLRVTPRLGLVGAPLLGAGFAIGWTPCIGPTLSVIITLSLQQASAGRAAVLASCYSLGLGLPFVCAAFGFTWMSRTMNFFKKHVRAVNIFGGVTLIVIGSAMLLGVWSVLMSALQVVMNRYGAVL